MLKRLLQVLSERTIIKSTVNKASKITSGIDSKEHVHQPSVLEDDDNNINDRKDIQMEAPNAVIEKESKVVAIDIKKEYAVSETKKETSLKASLIFLIPLKECYLDF